MLVQVIIGITTNLDKTKAKPRTCHMSTNKSKSTHTHNSNPLKNNDVLSSHVTMVCQPALEPPVVNYRLVELSFTITMGCVVHHATHRHPNTS